MNVYDNIPYDGPIHEPTGDAIVPVYGSTTYDEDGFEVYPIKDYVLRDAALQGMPPLKQQWADDWRRRVALAWRSHSPFWQPRMRAPKQFIETGVWPKDEPRPMTPDFYSKNKEIN
jgi:hypothetical protein